LSSGGQGEIASHALPHEMEFVVVKPHISSGTLDRVFLFFGIVGRRAWFINLADVVVALKDTERFRLGKRYRRYTKIDYGGITTRLELLFFIADDSPLQQPSPEAGRDACAPRHSCLVTES